MSEITDMLNAAFEHRESEFGAVLTIAGVDYPCSPSAMSNAKRMSEGGFSMNDDVIVCVRKNLFAGALPSEKTNCTYTASPTGTARSMKVDSVVIPPGESYIELHINARHQGA